MSRLTPIRPERMVRILEHLGFKLIRQRGSHAFYRHPDGRATVVPMHRGDLPRGTIREILKDVGISVEEYEKLRQQI